MDVLDQVIKSHFVSEKTKAWQNQTIFQIAKLVNISQGSISIETGPTHRSTVLGFRQFLETTFCYIIYMALYNMALLFIQFVIYIGVPKLYFIKNFEILIKAKHKEVSKESVCLDLGIPNRVMTRPF